jgi:hypothetical protein
MPTKEKLKRETEPSQKDATSTRTDTATGSHVVTIVTSNEAVAAEPAAAEPAAPTGVVHESTPTDGSDWLDLGRAAWLDKSQDHRMEVINFSAYNTSFECRGPHGCCRWVDLDNEYALSFVFQGEFIPRVRHFPPGTSTASDEIEAPVRHRLLFFR